METPNIILTKNYKTLNDDPQYFGGYLNMARLNIFNINNHFAKDFEFSPLPEEGHIKSSLLCDHKKKDVNWPLVYARIKPFIPILKVFDPESAPSSLKSIDNKTNIDFKDMSETLKLIFTELQEFRNDYSHYYSIVTGNKRKTTVSTEFAHFIKATFIKAIEYTKVRFKDVLSADDFDLVSKKTIVDNDNTITPEGFVFLSCMFLEREYAFLFISQIKGLKGTQYKSFLATRETLMAFCVKLPHDKFISSNKEQAFTLDIISELNRCPNELFKVLSDKEKQQFLPQLDNSNAKNLFENSLNENSLNSDIDYDTYMEDLTKRVRHKNRFFEFALRYIDENNILPKYKFQINLGKLLIAEYPKQFNGEEETRRITANVKAAGKLDDYKDEEAVIRKVVKTPEPKNFEIFAPKYHAPNNKIGLYLKSDTALLLPDKKTITGKRLHCLQPDAFLSLHELQKIILLNYLAPGKAEQLIDDFIGVNDKLLSWSFIQEIKALIPTEWDQFDRRTAPIKRSIDPQKRNAYSKGKLNHLLLRKAELDKVLEPFNVNSKQIPQRILDYWLNINDIDKSRTASEYIKQMKKDCTARLKAVDRYREEKKGHIPKVGQMATFLAKDIVNMIICPDKKKKITSFYYGKMQECLAYFANQEKKALFTHIITKELNLNAPDGHPFLSNLNMSGITNTLDFYEKYLQEKADKNIRQKNSRTGKYYDVNKSWLTKTFYQFNRDTKKTDVYIPDERSRIPYSIKQLEEKEPYDIKNWLIHKLEGKEETDKKHAVDLPTNLFDNDIKRAIEKELNTRGVTYAENAKWNELFKLWWQLNDDSIQPYYNADRHYVIYDEPVNFTPCTKTKFADYYSDALSVSWEKKTVERRKEQLRNRNLQDLELMQVEKVFKKSIAGTEKAIRLLQEEDRILLLMLKQMLPGQDDIKLKESAELLKKETEVKEVVPGKLFFNANGDIAQKEQQTTISRTIKTNRKRKDFTILRKFVFDRRLPELFEYFATDTVDMDILKKELDAYNKAKQMVLDAVFLLEKSIIEKDEEQVKLLFSQRNGATNIEHSTYLDWLSENEIINKNTQHFMNMVRNCFSHNQFPQKSTMDLQISRWNDNLWALQIAEAYQQVTNNMMLELKK